MGKTKAQEAEALMALLKDFDPPVSSEITVDWLVASATRDMMRDAMRAAKLHDRAGVGDSLGAISIDSPADEALVEAEIVQEESRLFRGMRSKHDDSLIVVLDDRGGASVAAALNKFAEAHPEIALNVVTKGEAFDQLHREGEEVESHFESNDLMIAVAQRISKSETVSQKKKPATRGAHWQSRGRAIKKRVKAKLAGLRL